MGIQCFLNFGNICHIDFRDIGIFFKIIKGKLDIGTPPPPSRASVSYFDCLQELIPVSKMVVWAIDPITVDKKCKDYVILSLFYLISNLYCCVSLQK